MARRAITKPKAPARPEAPVRARRTRSAKLPARREPEPETASATQGVLADAAERLDRLGERLARSLDEVPKATDFEPLAEHLYEFARQAPALAASLEELPKVAGPLAESVRALEAISETLDQANHSFSEALLRLPRAEDYEPLAEPLREFARVSPALATALREVLAVASPLAAMAAPLSESTRGLARVTATLEATGHQLAEAAAVFRERRDNEPTSRGSLPEVARHLDAAYEAVLEALAGLPRASDYEPAARQLREIASVSPSLMEWLREVPALTAPLTESVRALQGAAADLKAARGLVRDLAGDVDADDAAKLPRLND
jgi:ABC-type transporter Mla subunit MlaD